jgi:serine/threonine-protein kinase RsbW
MAREIELRIDSRLENVALVGAAVHAIAGGLGFTEGERANIELCVVEAVSNSVRHAYLGQPGHAVTVRVCADETGVEIHVLDDGHPVPEKNRIPREPDLDPSDLLSIPEGGRGTFLMHALMDTVGYGTEGAANLLVLKKALRGPEPT